MQAEGKARARPPGLGLGLQLNQANLSQHVGPPTASGNSVINLAPGQAPGGAFPLPDPEAGAAAGG